MTKNLQRTSEQWQALLKKHRIKPTRSMGQNFLTETAVVAEIVELAEIGPDDLVLEIGPGMGILSRQIISSGAELIAVELDRELATMLRGDLSDQPSFSLIEQDARFIKPEEIVGDHSYQVVANLPYSVATVILRNLIESTHPPTRMTVMVQREVAERMTAEPGDLSLLGLATDLYSEAEIVMIVPPSVFTPPPKVESSVVRMDIRQQLRGTAEQRSRMFELATMAFQRKRKTLSNGLSMGLDRPKQELDAILSECGIDPMRRPQTLNVDEWLTIAEALP